MIKIGLVSDTHNYLHPSVSDFLKPCDEIWHSGDIGSLSLANQLSEIKPLRGVYGNIDGNDIRVIYPKDLRFMCEDVDVWMTHIGGYPGKYPPEIKNILQENPPKLFICGHSHILKVIYDKKYNFLHINPGAAGKYGFHHFITAIRFNIDKSNITDLEILEIKK